MKSTLSILLIVVAITALIGGLGCGDNAADPTAPSSSGLMGADRAFQTEGHGILGLYELDLNFETGELTLVEPRQAETHYDITSYMAGHAWASAASWDPVTRILEFDLTLENATMVDVFDVRCLMLADPASGFEMLNPDDYTQLFNPFGPDDINPFRAYAKTAPDRIFGALTNYTEHFEIQFPSVVTLPARLLVECSWPSFCEDPYEISSQALSNPISTTVSGVITVDVLDHQWNVDSVFVDTTPITGGLISLINIGGVKWTGSLINTTGIAPGTYTCRIIADSLATTDDLYDYIDIVVVAPSGTLDWHSTDYGIPSGGCSLDLGVIADPGGPRDSNILMIDTDVKTCDLIIKHDAHYSSYSNYVGLYSYDPTNDTYQPYPVVRIDAADDGAFSFTNENWDMFWPTAASGVYNTQVWSVFDRTPALHLGPAPDEGRYYFDLTNYDALSLPVDVCDDFSLGQYALFSAGSTCYSPRDLVVIGTMPATYTHDHVLYVGNLDAFVGSGDGFVAAENILGIDVIEYTEDGDVIQLYILEDDGSGPQVEVYGIMDTTPGWGDDAVWHTMTIDVNYWIDEEILADGKDIEILPPRSDYEPNPSDPTLCVLATYNYWCLDHGEVLLYNAVTGAFLESIGDFTNPALVESKVHFLDTDDGDWEIHVTRIDVAGNVLATVFDYS